MPHSLSIHVQNAVADDLGDLLRLENLCFSSKQPYRKVLKRYFLSQLAHCLVARQDRQIVGYALIVFTPNMKTANLMALGVLPQLRQHGVGSNLLQWAEIEAIQSGASQLQLEVSFDNMAALHLFSENGLCETPDATSLIPQFSDGMKMKKRLFSENDSSLPHVQKMEIELQAMNADHFNPLVR